MKVIILQDVLHVGRKGEVKEVSDGHARNFLIPRGLAKPATEAALRGLAAQKERTRRELTEGYQKYKAVAEKLKSLTLNFKLKVGEKGRSFGSVTAVKIRDALKKQGVPVEKEWVLLEEPIKTVGETEVEIKFPQELKGRVKVIVETEKNKPQILE